MASPHQIAPVLRADAENEDAVRSYEGPELDGRSIYSGPPLKKARQAVSPADQRRAAILLQNED